MMLMNIIISVADVSWALCAGTMLITLHKRSHMILQRAPRGSVIIASFTKRAQMPREARKRVHGNTANEGWVGDVSPSKLTPEPMLCNCSSCCFWNSQCPHLLLQLKLCVTSRVLREFVFSVVSLSMLWWMSITSIPCVSGHYLA